MKRPALVLVFLALSLLAACQSEQSYRKELRTWLGKTEAELIAARGVPDQAFVSGDNIRYLTYHSSSLNKSSSRAVCNSTTSVTGFSATTSCQQLYCKETFRIEKNIIENVKAEGNNCL